MKTKSRFFLIGIFLFFVALVQLTAQDVRKLQPFDEVSVTGDIEVILEKGTEDKATIEARNMNPDDVSVFVRRGELKIKLLNSLFTKDEDVTVYLTYTQLRSVRAYAGARVRGNDTLQGDKLEVRSASGAQVDLDIDVNALEAAATEGGMLDLKGKTISQDVVASTGGQYQALDLSCERTYVRANTGGQATVVAYKFLDASANTGGQIEYEGNPEEKNTKSLITGAIRKL